MKASDREMDERAGRLLRAGRPAYPGDLDRKLRERLVQVKAEERPVQRRIGLPGWALAASSAAAIVVIAAGLLWRAPNRPRAPVSPVAPVEGVAAVAARPLQTVPEIRVGPAPLPPVPLAQQRAARRRAEKRPSSGEAIRMEFSVPERAMTILWEQRSDFDLAALMAEG